MLGRLIKNEFKSTAHSLIPVYLALAVAIALSLVSVVSKSELMSVLSSLILALIGMTMIIVTFVCIVLNFNKSLYGAQGYLSFTLPVKSSNLLGSKTIVSFIWMLLSYLIMIVIMGGIFIYAKSVAVDQYGMETLTTIKNVISIYANIPNTATLIRIAILFCTSIFASMLMIIMNIYFAITCANTRMFQQNNVLWSLLIFFGVRIFIGNVVIKLFCKVAPCTLAATAEGMKIVANAAKEGYYFSVNITELIVQIIAIVGLFFATTYFMKNKVNVK